MTTLNLGSEIYASGDYANISHFGRVIDIKNSTKYNSTQYKIESLEDGHSYWIDDYLVSNKYDGSGLHRIVPKQIYIDYRNVQLELLRNRLNGGN